MDLTKVLSAVKSKKTGFFAAGVLFGTAGIKALSSKDAKKLYTNCTAAVLRAKECVMDTVATVSITHSFARRTAAVQFVYNFFASLLDNALIPAVPNKTPAAKNPVFLLFTADKTFVKSMIFSSCMI